MTAANHPESGIAAAPEAHAAPPSGAFSILLISHSYPPVLGGSETEAQRVCAALRLRGHNVKVLCAGGPPMPAVKHWIDPAGIPVQISGAGRFKDYLFALAVVRALLQSRGREEIVYFLMQGLHLAAGLPVARMLGKPAVVKISGSGIITTLRKTWLGRLELRFLRKWARRVMILNPGMEQEAAAAGLSPDRLLWMPNPVDTLQFAPVPLAQRLEIRARLGIAPDAGAILFVGRLAPEKELGLLLDAFALAAPSIENPVLILVGEGPCRKDLSSQAERLGVDGRIRFPGRQNVDQVRDWLRAADAFALPSSNEGFPCSLIEAMAVGLPSVVSDIPANMQIVEHGVHGLHATLGDPASISSALIRLFTGRDQAARMGAAARRLVVENYSVEKVIARYERLFTEVARCAR